MGRSSEYVSRRAVDTTTVDYNGLKTSRAHGARTGQKFCFRSDFRSLDMFSDLGCASEQTLIQTSGVIPLQDLHPGGIYGNAKGSNLDTPNQAHHSPASVALSLAGELAGR